ncbi:MAG: allantoinase, partial [Sphingobacteriales bacterium]
VWPRLALVLSGVNSKAQGRREKPVPYAAYLASRPKHWEDEAVRWIIDLCRKYRCRVHIVHVSSAGALTSIAAAKQEGLPITAETCPHYLFFEAEAIPDGETVYKCAPPIRERANNDLLIGGLKNGTLDFIASDHSPAPPETKELVSGNLARAWGGIAGLQYLLPASWTALRSRLSLEEFIPLLTSRPAAFLGLEQRKGAISPGLDADLVVWRPETEYTTEVQQLQHRHKISPYLDRRLYGCVLQSFVRGAEVFNRGEFSSKPAGTWLFRK